jgi:hypothetical protein
MRKFFATLWEVYRVVVGVTAVVLLLLHFVLPGPSRHAARSAHPSSDKRPGEATGNAGHTPPGRQAK